MTDHAAISCSRALLVCTLVVASNAACSGERVRVPSDPTSWDRAGLGLPAASERCPGGEIRIMRDDDPKMRPMTLAAYAETRPRALDRLRGVRNTDAVYPFYIGHVLADGSDTGMGGFLLVRDGCIIHAEINEYDN
jgi:hypothetical protein